MSRRLEGNIALVTGSARGIGLETAHALAREGAQVAIGDLDGGAANRAAKSVGHEALGFQLDVRDEGSVVGVLDAVRRRLGVVQILVANAGISQDGFLHETTLADWQRVLAVNLTGTFLVCKHVVAGLLRIEGGGAIVCHASVSGLVALPTEPAYAASKAGVLGLVRAIAVDYAPRGIRCNAVCPGVVDSPMTKPLWERGLRNELSRRHPLGIGEPADVAALTTFLVSKEARWITGAVFAVDGGYTAL